MGERSSAWVRNQESELWNGLKAGREAVGRWGWVCRVTWLQERGKNLGLHPKEAQEHSDHQFRDSIPLEISHVWEFYCWYHQT